MDCFCTFVCIDSAPTWIQCEECLKWRSVPPDYYDNIPDTWHCSQNPNRRYRCVSHRRPWASSHQPSVLEHVYILLHTSSRRNTTHVLLYVIVKSSLRVTLPTLWLSSHSVSRPLPTVPGQSKCTVLEGGTERSRWSNKQDFWGQTCLCMLRIAKCECDLILWGNRHVFGDSVYMNLHKTQ